MSSSQSSRYARGVAAEQQAADFLREAGCDIVATRYKTPHGEIDLIANDAGAYIFCEVKRRPTMDSALTSITRRQQLRIMNAAMHFAAEKGADDMEMRFDVICVDASGALTHLPNAFCA